LTIYFDGDATPGTGRFDGGTVDGGAPADAIQLDIAAQMNQACACGGQTTSIGTATIALPAS
jgi:hypothetical protein